MSWSGQAGAHTRSKKRRARRRRMGGGMFRGRRLGHAYRGFRGRRRGGGTIRFAGTNQVSQAYLGEMKVSLSVGPLIA